MVDDGKTCRPFDEMAHLFGVLIKQLAHLVALIDSSFVKLLHFYPVVERDNTKVG